MFRNNDKSIRIFSLTQACLLKTLEFPTAMNHASLSPDGKLLLAVGDRHTAFFCRRVRLPCASNGGVSSYARYEWHEITGLKLSLAESKDACKLFLGVSASRSRLLFGRETWRRSKIILPRHSSPPPSKNQSSIYVQTRMLIPQFPRFLYRIFTIRSYVNIEHNLSFVSQNELREIFRKGTLLLLFETAYDSDVLPWTSHADVRFPVDICAVASQNGIITILNTALIHDNADADEAIIEVLRSSRPSVYPHYIGAVRSMSFSPGPWDLLAW